MIRPLYDRILVKRLPSIDKTPGGIIIPEDQVKPMMEGTAIAVGDGRLAKDGTLVPLEVKQGDRVIFGKFGGTPLLIENEELLLFRESELLGIRDNSA